MGLVGLCIQKSTARCSHDSTLLLAVCQAISLTQAAESPDEHATKDVVTRRSAELARAVVNRPTKLSIRFHWSG